LRGDASDPPHYSASSQAHHKAPPIATIATQMQANIAAALMPDRALWIVDNDVNLFGDA